MTSSDRLTFTLSIFVFNCSIVVAPIITLVIKSCISQNFIDKNINEIGYFANGEPSVEFRENNKDVLLKNTPFKHF